MFKGLLEKFVTSKGEYRMCLREKITDIWKFAISLSITIFVIITNSVFSKLIEKMVNLVGFHT